MDINTNPSPRIVIVGNARSGTTMLLNALKSHSQLNLFDEILVVLDPMSDHAIVRKEIYKQCYRQEMQLIDNSILIDFREISLYPFMREIFYQANGFKILFWHTCSFSENVWTSLQMFDPHIIYVERNPIECYISERLATLSGVWNTTDSSERYHPDPINLTPDCISGIQFIDNLPKQFMASYGNSFKITRINYHELTNDWEGASRYLQEEIGVEYNRLEVPNKKVLFRDTFTYVKNWKEFSTWCSCAGIEVPEVPKRKILI